MTDQLIDQNTLITLEQALQEARIDLGAKRQAIESNKGHLDHQEDMIRRYLVAAGEEDLVKVWDRLKQHVEDFEEAKEEAKKREKEAKDALTQAALQYALDNALFGKLTPSGNTSASRKTEIRFPTENAEAMATAVKWVIGIGLGDTISVKTHGYTKLYQATHKAGSLPEVISILDTPGIRIADSKWVALEEPVES